MSVNGALQGESLLTSVACVQTLGCCEHTLCIECNTIDEELEG